MATIQDLAQETSALFIQHARPSLTRTARRFPARFGWVDDMVRAAQQDRTSRAHHRFLDDWLYRFIDEALLRFMDTEGGYIELAESIDEVYPDHDIRDLLAWAGSHRSREAYVDDAIANRGHYDIARTQLCQRLRHHTLDSLLRLGQTKEIRHVYRTVLDALQAQTEAVPVG